MKAWALALVFGIATPAAAQLLGGGGLGGGGLGSAVGGVTGGVLGAPESGSGVVGGLDRPLMALGGAVQSLAPGDLLTLRKERLRALVRDNRTTLDVDDQGNLVRRDEILGLGLDADALAKAKAAGFSVSRTETMDGFGPVTTVLVPPRGKPARKAIETLRVFDPAGTYTLDHVYEPARAPLSPAKGPAAGGAPMPAGGTRIGLIDGGVGRHPAFAGAEIEQRGFAGDARPSGHGTAVASLIVGSAGSFRGAAPGTPLLVADVYGGSASNGSALAIVRAMAWLAQKGARMVNISLVGPPNPLLEAGVKALMARGILVVAAVGNDGPSSEHRRYGAPRRERCGRQCADHRHELGRLGPQRCSQRRWNSPEQSRLDCRFGARSHRVGGKPGPQCDGLGQRVRFGRSCGCRERQFGIRRGFGIGFGERRYATFLTTSQGRVAGPFGPAIDSPRRNSSVVLLSLSLSRLLSAPSRPFLSLRATPKCGLSSVDGSRVASVK